MNALCFRRVVATCLLLLGLTQCSAKVVEVIAGGPLYNPLPKRRPAQEGGAEGSGSGVFLSDDGREGRYFR